MNVLHFITNYGCVYAFYSASMEINGEMGVDAHVARTGLKMQTTLHTSTSTEGKIKMQNGRIFELDIKAPEDNTEIITAKLVTNYKHIHNLSHISTKYGKICFTYYFTIAFII